MAQPSQILPLRQSAVEAGIGRCASICIDRPLQLIAKDYDTQFANPNLFGWPAVEAEVAKSVELKIQRVKTLFLRMHSAPFLWDMLFMI